jgi:hypothetical protein
MGEGVEGGRAEKDDSKKHVPLPIYFLYDAGERNEILVLTKGLELLSGALCIPTLLVGG